MGTPPVPIGADSPKRERLGVSEAGAQSFLSRRSTLVVERKGREHETDDQNESQGSDGFEHVRFLPQGVNNVALSVSYPLAGRPLCRGPPPGRPVDGGRLATLRRAGNIKTRTENLSQGGGFN
jgi:hypothetical protein